MPLITELKHRAKLARRTVHRARQRIRFGQFDAPILFANSFPKSGTHLLTQILRAFSRFGPFVDSSLPAVVTFDGPTGRQRSPAEITTDLDRLLPGDIAYGHLHAVPEIVEVLCRDGIAPYFILRDPRDVVVSHVFYVTELETDHVHHDYYVSELKDFGERLMASILGRPESSAPFPDIRARFEPYIGWLARPEVLLMRYEDFIQHPEDQLRRIFDHAVARGFAFRSSWHEAKKILSAAVQPHRSPTFREGKVGGWKEHFTEEHKRVFKEVAGDLLVSLGYEQGHGW
jgi:hypothetical protein